MNRPTVFAMAGLVCTLVAFPVLGQPLAGTLRKGVYTSPGSAFTMPVPEMFNPFVKKPATSRDRRLADDGAEVEFAVRDLGEAWLFGARGRTQDPDARLGADCDAELRRWVQAGADFRVITEEAWEDEAGGGMSRVYWVAGASILFRIVSGAAPAREDALVAVRAWTRAGEPGRLYYVVGQFDMPNKGGFYTLDTQRGQEKLAAEQLRRVKVMSGLMTYPKREGS